MAKTQPLIMAPEAKAPVAAVTVAPSIPVPSSRADATGIDAIPRSLVWAVFGFSAVTFLIQIWNYFSS